MRLAVASGKGGTGKTLVATSLAWHLAQGGSAVRYVDGDVEAPNGHLFLHPRELHSSRVAVGVPALRPGRCTGCGDCQRACAFNAILALPGAASGPVGAGQGKVLLFNELCHSCGACLLACPAAALGEQPLELGTLMQGEAEPGIAFLSATLDVGQARATPLIDALVRRLEQPAAAADGAPGTAAADGAALTILDAPPGTSCSATAVVRAADRVLLVTEPTPFGLHDLELAVTLCRALERPVSAVINRADLGDRRVHRFLEREGVPLWGEIPFSQEVARAYAEGEVVARNVELVRPMLEQIALRLRQETP